MITELTRRDLFDQLRADGFIWHGRLRELEFLERILNLKALPSSDRRFENAADDIWQHRENNSDWGEDWVYSDPRIDLLHCPEERFIEFLCQTIHPIVRPDEAEVQRVLALYNEHLRGDGWELYSASQLSGHPVFGARESVPGASHAVESVRAVAKAVDTQYVAHQSERLTRAVDVDPELAIGTAKELVETVCKTILDERSIRCDARLDFPQLVRLTLQNLQLAPDDIPDHAEAAGTIRRLLQNLACISNSMAELRNLYGTGHGKVANAGGLRIRHARLAAGAASTVAMFLIETHQKKVATR